MASLLRSGQIVEWSNLRKVQSSLWRSGELRGGKPTTATVYHDEVFMGAKLSKAELLSGLKVLRAAQLDTSVVSDRAEQGARTEVRQEYEQTRSLEGIAIARAEMARGDVDWGR